MTATAIEVCELEGLDFQLSCQATNARVWNDGRVEIEPNCDNPATHMARVHQSYNCEWIEKFLCTDCLTIYGDPCFECALTPRIDSVVPLGAA